MSYPQFWIAKPCRHWSPELNARFRIYRIDSGADYVGRYTGSVWDGELRQWKEQAWRISPEILLRPAHADEIPQEELPI